MASSGVQSLAMIPQELWGRAPSRGESAGKKDPKKNPWNGWWEGTLNPIPLTPSMAGHLPTVPSPAWPGHSQGSGAIWQSAQPLATLPRNSLPRSQPKLPFPSGIHSLCPVPAALGPSPLQLSRTKKGLKLSPRGQQGTATGPKRCCQLC
uniref:Uncharacterized protein n=1 Tax=Malurus cyaneus samueli TaxID=2593467 RepID=A0A8C5THL9_9PASS